MLEGHLAPELCSFGVDQGAVCTRESGGDVGRCSNTAREVGRRHTTSADLLGQGQKLILAGIQHEVEVAAFVERMAGINLTGVDRHHAAVRSHVFCAAIPELRGTLPYHSNRDDVVRMTGERLLHITRLQHVDTAQERNSPESSLVPLERRSTLFGAVRRALHPVKDRRERRKIVQDALPGSKLALSTWQSVPSLRSLECRYCLWLRRGQTGPTRWPPVSETGESCS